jgi:hypothetical protein
MATRVYEPPVKKATVKKVTPAPAKKATVKPPVKKVSPAPAKAPVKATATKSRIYEPKPKPAPKPKSSAGNPLRPAPLPERKAVPYKDFQKREESPNLGGRNLTAPNKIVGTAKGGKAYGNTTRDMTRAWHERNHPYATPPPPTSGGGVDDGRGAPQDSTPPREWPEGGPEQSFEDNPAWFRRIQDETHQVSRANPKPKRGKKPTRGTA